MLARRAITPSGGALKQLRLPFASSLHVLRQGTWHYAQDCPGFPHCSVDGIPEPLASGPPVDDRDLVDTLEAVPVEVSARAKAIFRHPWRRVPDE